MRSLLDALATVTEGDNGILRVMRNGQTMSLHPPKHKDITAIEDLLAVRHFLEQSKEAVVPAAVAPGIRLLVVIDHHEAKVYRTESPGPPHSRSFLTTPTVSADTCVPRIQRPTANGSRSERASMKPSRQHSAELKKS